eukprot:3750019-Pleurochrysis_carterae.AAC.1
MSKGFATRASGGGGQRTIVRERKSEMKELAQARARQRAAKQRGQSAQTPLRLKKGAGSEAAERGGERGGERGKTGREGKSGGEGKGAGGDEGAIEMGGGQGRGGTRQGRGGRRQGRGGRRQKRGGRRQLCG